MKLTKKTLIETLRVLEGRGTVYQARKKAGISVSRTYQIWNQYIKTGKIPELGKNIGGPSRPIKKREERIVKAAYEKYKVCASKLRRLIRRDFNIDMPHYHIHKILLKTGFANQKENKDVRKKKSLRASQEKIIQRIPFGYLSQTLCD